MQTSLDCLTRSDMIAVAALIVSSIGLWIAYRAARIQVVTFLITVLAGKAKEANDYADLGEKNASETLSYQHSIAALVQATQIYELLRRQHRFLLMFLSCENVMHGFYLQWRTGLQNKIFADPKFENFLTEGKAPDDVGVIQNHLKQIKAYLQGSHDKYAPRIDRTKISCT